MQATRVRADGFVVALTAFLLIAAMACEKKAAETETRPQENVESATTPGQKDGEAKAKPAAKEVIVKSQEVAKGLFMLTGKGGNIAVLTGRDKILIVDDQFADVAPLIKAEIEKISSLSAGAIEFVLNTHFHGDHTGANKVFGKDAHIVAHRNVRKRLVSGDEPSEGLPVVTYDKEMGIHFAGEDIRLVHLPGGHTDGDSAVFFTKANVVHLGDNFFNGMLPFVDLQSGGSPEALLASTESLLKTIASDATLIPGHGPVATMADYKKFRDMLADTIAAVRKAKKSGNKLADVEKAGFGGKYKSWESSFVNEAKWAATIFKSLK